MSRWYQNVLSGVQVEVLTLEDDDFYQDNSANWARIATPAPKPEPAVIVEPEPEPETEPESAPAPKPAPAKLVRKR
jgi:hypothetical protein